MYGMYHGIDLHIRLHLLLHLRFGVVAQNRKRGDVQSCDEKYEGKEKFAA